MVYLQLFLTFFKIGVISFGGGMGMLPVMLDEIVFKGGLITEESFYNMVAVSESTPGPIAVNMATYLGYDIGGVLGSLVATLSVVLPAFIIILLIAICLKKLFNNKYLNGAVTAVSPVIISLLFVTGVLLILQTVLAGFKSTVTAFNYKQLILITSLFIIYYAYKSKFKKNVNPIILVILGGIFGAILL